MKGLEEVDFLARSENRLRVLEALTKESRDLRDLKDHLGIPRTTVQRNLGDLRDRGWIRETTEGHKATSLGEMILDAFMDLVDITQSAEDLSSFMRWVECTHIDTGRLKSAEVTTSKPHDPHAPLKRFMELLDGCGGARIASHSVFPSYIEAHHRKVVEEGLELEVVLGSEAATVLREDYGKELYDLLEKGNSRVLINEGDSIPLTIGLLGGTVGLLAYDGDGMPRALLESDADETREWAEETYLEYRNGARPLALNRVGPAV